MNGTIRRDQSKKPTTTGIAAEIEIRINTVLSTISPGVAIVPLLVNLTPHLLPHPLNPQLDAVIFTYKSTWTHDSNKY